MRLCRPCQAKCDTNEGIIRHASLILARCQVGWMVDLLWIGDTCWLEVSGGQVMPNKYWLSCLVSVIRAVMQGLQRIQMVGRLCSYLVASLHNMLKHKYKIYRFKYPCLIPPVIKYKLITRAFSFVVCGDKNLYVLWCLIL